MNIKTLSALITKGREAVVGLDGSITMLYGEKKVGKSTFWSNAPKPLFLDCEDGLRTVAGKDGKIPDHIQVSSWADIEEATTALEQNPGKYKTLVVDGMAECAGYLRRHILEQAKTDHINEGSLGYGKGKDKMVEAFNAWFARIRKLDMTIALVAHDRTTEDEFNGVKFNKRIPLLDGGKRGAEMWQGIMPSVSMVLFAYRERTKDGIVHRLRCQGDTMVEAGNPFNLPENISFEYDQLVKGIEACRSEAG